MRNLEKEKHVRELQLVALDLGGGGRTVAILRSVLCRSLFAIFTFRSVGLSRGIEQDQHKRDEALRSREVCKRKTYREPVLRSSC